MSEAEAKMIRDRETHSISKREFTDQGYLRVPGKIARSGVQYYTARDLGLTDRAPGAMVGVYRPPDEVFSDESLGTYEDADVTIEHPGSLVDPDTHKRDSVGHVTDRATQAGDFVEAPIIIKDANAIREVEAGKVELSAGYRARYIPEQGTTDSGESYEFVQRNIRINHVALVSRARAGREARLYDHDRGKDSMFVTIDGQSVEVEDSSKAQLLQNTIDSVVKRATDAENLAKTERESKDSVQAERDKLAEDNEKLKEQTSDAAISKRVQEIHDTQSKAVKVAGDSFSCDSLDPVAIKRAALKQSRPSMDWSDKSEEYVNAAFDMSHSEKEKEAEEDKDKRQKASDSAAQLGKDMRDSKGDDGNGQATIDSAYEKMMERKRNAASESK